MADQLSRARTDLATLEAKIAFLETERQKAIRAAEELRIFIRLFEVYSAEDASSSGPIPIVSGGFTRPERVAIIAAEMIEASKRRVGVSDITTRAEAAGLRIPGKDEAGKRNYVSGILSRDNRFHGIRRRGWWLRSLGVCPGDPPSENTEAADPYPEVEELAASAEPRLDQRGNGSEPVNPWPGGGT